MKSIIWILSFAVLTAFAGGKDVSGDNITTNTLIGNVNSAVTTVGDINALKVETDPTVPAWAKENEKPRYSAGEVGARPNDWMPNAQDVGALPVGEETLKTTPAFSNAVIATVAPVIPKKASDVGARPNDWMPTAADVGAVAVRAKGSVAIGEYTTASGYYSHAEGFDTTASGDYSHAEGYYTTAAGEFSHAEGNETTASGYSSHTEGAFTTASGNCSHAEGVSANANENYAFSWNGDQFTLYNSHGEGTFNVNPVGGLSGLWIGGLNLATILGGYAKRTGETETVDFRNTRTMVKTQLAPVGEDAVNFDMLVSYADAAASTKADAATVEALSVAIIAATNGVPKVTDSTVAGWGYIKSWTETDPTISAWAKENEKPTYTAAEVGALEKEWQDESYGPSVVLLKRTYSNVTSPLFKVTETPGPGSTTIYSWYAEGFTVPWSRVTGAPAIPTDEHITDLAVEAASSIATTYASTNALVSLNQSVQYVTADSNGSAVEILAPTNSMKDWVVYIYSTTNNAVLFPTGTVYAVDSTVTNALKPNVVTALYLSSYPAVTNGLIVGRQEMNPIVIVR